MKTKEKYAELIINRIAEKLSIDISKYDMNEMVQGMFVELEHGSKDEETNLTDDDAVETFKIMLAHIKEIPDYYTRLDKMESEAQKISGEETEEAEEIEKEESLNEAKRFKELCGLVENSQKKQLINDNFKYKVVKIGVNVLAEDLNLDDFEVIKFNKESIGKKKGLEEVELYSMEERKDKKNDLE